MPIYLGSTPVSLKLGAQDVAGYLGDTAVTVVARTLYFTGAVDNDWAELGNWFDDAEGAFAASSLPTAVDSVVALEDVDENGGDEPTVANLTVDGKPYQEFSIDITVTGLATFGGDNDGVGYAPYVTLTGNAVFNSTVAASSLYGTVIGNATFNGVSRLLSSGNVTGTATFNEDACNSGGTAGTFAPNPPPACG